MSESHSVAAPPADAQMRAANLSINGCERLVESSNLAPRRPVLGQRVVCCALPPYHLAFFLTRVLAVMRCAVQVAWM